MNDDLKHGEVGPTGVAPIHVLDYPHHPHPLLLTQSLGYVENKLHLMVAILPKCSDPS